MNSVSYKSDLILNNIFIIRHVNIVLQNKKKVQRQCVVGALGHTNVLYILYHIISLWVM